MVFDTAVDNVKKLFLPDVTLIIACGPKACMYGDFGCTESITSSETILTSEGTTFTLLNPPGKRFKIPHRSNHNSCYHFVALVSPANTRQKGTLGIQAT